MIRPLVLAALLACSAAAQAPEPASKELGPTYPPEIKASEQALYDITTPAQRAMTLTREQYEARGRRLSFAADSAWVPEQLKRDVLNAISAAFALDMADELSWRDFFHGHVESPIGGPGEPIGDAVRKAKAYAEACRPSAYEPRDWRVSPAEFSRRVFAANGPCPAAEVEAAYRAAISAVAGNPGRSMLFHTRETTYEEKDPRQTNRNLRALADGSLFRVSDARADESERNASLQLMFFPDANGELHAYVVDPAYWSARFWHRFYRLPSPR